MSPEYLAATRMRDRDRIFAIIAFFAALTTTSSLSAATYYVSSTTGNDANTGLAPASPWKNSPGMAAYSGTGALSPGDSVYFNSADTWLVSGTQGLYLVGGVQYIGNTWGSGIRATLRAGSNIDSAVVRFRDHPAIATELKGFDVDANGKVANGIEMNHSFYAGPLTGATKRVEDVVVHHVWSRTSLGQYKYGIILSNHGGTGGEVANVEIVDSVVHDISRDGLPIYPGDENANCIVRNVTVRRTTVYNTGQDPDYGAGAGIVVKGRVIDAVLENNYVHSTKGAGIFVNGNETNHFGFGPTNIHIRYNIVAVNTAHASIRVYDGPSGGDPKEVNIYGNLVYGNAQGAGMLVGSDVRGANSLRIYNNTFYGNPVSIAAAGASFPVLEFRNNIIRVTSGVALTEDGRFTGHSNNIFHGGSVLVSSAGVAFGTANLGSYEASASALDPFFIDPARLPTGFTGSYGVNLKPNTDGLALRGTSYGIGHGASLPPPYSGSINGVPRATGKADIGAYQSDAGSSPPLPPTNLRVVSRLQAPLQHHTLPAS